MEEQTVTNNPGTRLIFPRVLRLGQFSTMMTMMVRYAVSTETFCRKDRQEIDSNTSAF